MENNLEVADIFEREVEYSRCVHNREQRCLNREDITFFENGRQKPAYNFFGTLLIPLFKNHYYYLFKSTTTCEEQQMTYNLYLRSGMRATNSTHKDHTTKHQVPARIDDDFLFNKRENDVYNVFKLQFEGICF